MNSFSLFHSLLLALLLVALSACSGDESVVGGDEKDKRIYVTLTLDLAETAADATRETTAHKPDDNKWGTQSYKWIDEVVTVNGVEINPGEDEGDGYDNGFDPYTLQVLFYKPDGTYVCEVHNHELRPLTKEKQPNEYTFRGWLKPDQVTPGQDYKVVVMLNFPQPVPAGTSLANAVANTTFGWFNAQGQPTTRHIPLCGVRKYNQLPLIDNGTLNLEKMDKSPYNAGKIFLLRALSRIELRLSRAVMSEGYTLSRASRLTRANMGGYCFPTGFESVTATTSLVRNDCLHPLDNALTAAQPLYVKTAAGPDDKNAAVTTGDYGQWITFYAPEMRNTETNTGAIDVTLRNQDGRTKTFKAAIPFRYLSDYYEVWNPVENGQPIGQTVQVAQGTPYPLLRNYEYRFIIQSVADEGFRFTATIANMEVGQDWTYEY